MLTLRVVERDSVRVMVFDRRGRLLLLHTIDPAEPQRGTCWELPGGGLEPGETPSEAAKRELYEETGITVDDVGPCLSVIVGTFTFNGCVYRQPEYVFKVDVSASDCDPPRLDGDIERAAHLGHRWWAARDIVAAKENLYPPGLAELVVSACADRP